MTTPPPVSSSRPLRPTRRDVLAGLARAGLVGAGAAGLAACGGKGSKAVAPSTTAGPPTVPVTDAPVTTAPPLTGPVAPLTGLAATAGDAAAAARTTRPSLVVKIDNAPEARPQAGLDAADVVVEEVVEGGVVRFLAVFQSREAALVGPVRSVRPVDPTIVTPLRGYFAYSGGAPPFVALIRQAPVKLVGYDELTAAYTKRKDRKPPHTFYTGTEVIYRTGGAAVGPPPALFSYRAGGAPLAGGTPVARTTIVMGALTTATWDWDAPAGVFRRGTNGTAHVVENGPQLGFANVVIQVVPYRNTTAVDVSGAPVPEATITGQGDAWFLSGGAQAKGRWSRGGASDVTAYTIAGQPAGLAPGATWLMLAPTGAPVTFS